MEESSRDWAEYHVSARLPLANPIRTYVLVQVLQNLIPNFNPITGSTLDLPVHLRYLIRFALPRVLVQALAESNPRIS